ncbi:hypothetical protein ACHQM5_011162 [Ranunculus cassubicifolius]
MADNSKLRVIVFPWLAFGHLLPALHLSKSLASKGIHVSFISTPKNIQRLPPLPSSLSPLITFITFPFPRIENFPENAESSTDIPPSKASLLMKAFDLLQPHFAKYLDDQTHPDWIIYDYASHWLPELAAKYNIPSVYFGTFNAASLSFLGPPSNLLSKDPSATRFNSIESFTTVPKWIPFSSKLVYRIHELLPVFERAAAEAASGAGNNDVSEAYRFGIAMRDSKCIALRSCVELEPEWIGLLSQLTGKPVIPVGSLHPLSQDFKDETTQDDEEKWGVISELLEKFQNGSVIYVSFGTEAELSQDQVTQLAIGLENSNLPFFWVLRNSHDSFLPAEFKNRVKDRGAIWTSWAPQVKILAHRSIGGVLTHCGWSSIIEALGFGRALVLMPIMSDQGLNARLMEGKKLGVEVTRDLRDGSFTSESVAESVRKVMMEEDGEIFRENAMKMTVLGEKAQMGRYLDEFVDFLLAHKRSL